MDSAVWYKDWFNSPYYHILYKNRDESEAAMFIDNLIKHLKINKNDAIWDLACGKGRHSIYLNAKGLNVTGTDLATNNIEEANKSANDRLEFFVHDMRTPFRINYYNFVLNLFTSIGYFENKKDNLKVFKVVYNALKPDGKVVIDFFNCKRVVDCMVSEELKQIDGIDFKISKSVIDGKIVKRIEFRDNSKPVFFEEKVSLLNKSDFLTMANQCGFQLESEFGDYQLNPFDPDSSERLILIFKK